MVLYKQLLTKLILVSRKEFFLFMNISPGMQIFVKGAPLHCRLAYGTTGLAAALTARHTNVPGCTLTTATGPGVGERCFASIARQDLDPFEWETMWDSITLQHVDVGKELV
jgi:hypothetical protein